MNIHTITIDDFYPCPGAIRTAALATPFETVEFGGHEYHGINRSFQPERFDEYLGHALGSRVSTKIGFFRMGNPAIKSTSHIHWDNIGTPWACVWYLSEPNDPKCVAAGTSLWRHKETGLTRYNRNLANQTHGMVERLVADGEDESK